MAARDFNCSIEGCDKPAEKRGWCSTHYRRWFRTGSPLIVRPHPKKHGLQKHPLYKLWNTMMQRCYNPKQVQYHRYGAKGIRVCDRWHKVEAFIEDMHPRPEGCTLDRYPHGAGNYEPSNVRWATPTQQSRNRKSNKLTIEFARWIRELHSTGATIPDIARRFRIHVESARNVVKQKTWRE